MLLITMYSLLLLLFMMANTQDTKLQDAQTPIVFEQVQEKIDQIGYTHRPLNARTQTNNVYLDSVFAQDTDRAITSASLTTVPSYNYYSKIWNYWRDKVNWQVTIPVDWTYNVSFYAAFEANALWLRLVILNVNWNPVDLANYVSDWITSVASYLHVSQPYNLKKWDIITIQVYQSSTSTLEVTTNLKVIRLS